MWFSSASKESELAPTSPAKNCPLSTLCWGYSKPLCNYVGKPYNVHALLNDPYLGAQWVPKVHIKAKVSIAGQIVEIGGTFRHGLFRCLSVIDRPFDDLTCFVCLDILQEGDFQLRSFERTLHPKRGVVGILDKVDD